MMSDEQAKAVQEVAKAVHKGVDLTQEAGGFFSKTFGGAIEHIAAAMEDKAFGYRVVNRAATAKKIQQRLERLGITNFKAIDYRSGIPLIEAISDEPDETIQSVWAAYVANALDPESKVVTSRQIIGIIKQLEPFDFNVISVIRLEELKKEREGTLSYNFHNFDTVKLEQSLARLTALGLFSFWNDSTHLTRQEHIKPWACRVSVKSPLGQFRATPLLIQLKEAIGEPGAGPPS